MNQRPDLYSAAIIGSPLVGHEALFAPARRRFVGRRIWRPRQARATGPSCPNIRPTRTCAQDVRYPAGLLLQSTKDDRVHPGHARKAAARFIEYGNRVYFHEYMEGGHSVGADHAEDAKRSAMLLMYLDRELGVAAPAPAVSRGARPLNTTECPRGSSLRCSHRSPPRHRRHRTLRRSSQAVCLPRTIGNARPWVCRLCVWDNDLGTGASAWAQHWHLPTSSNIPIERPAAASARICGWGRAAPIASRRWSAVGHPSSRLFVPGMFPNNSRSPAIGPTSGTTRK